MLGNNTLQNRIKQEFFEEEKEYINIKEILKNLTEYVEQEKELEKK